MTDIFIETFLHYDEHCNYGVVPTYQTKGSACADISLPSAITVPAHQSIKVDCLISFNIPKGYKIIMYPRSSLLIKYNLLQPVSIIDTDYKGHLHVVLYNVSQSSVYLRQGTHVAQIECVPATNVNNWPRFKVERNGGFGSTSNEIY